jgi:Ca2+-binding EF-hand superfamily protein
MLSAVFMSGSIVAADESQSPAEAMGGPGGVVSGGLLKLFDRDGNGQLDDDERRSGAADLLKRFDRNRNGRLDPDEQTAALVELGARRPSPKRKESVSLESRLLKRFDEDHDGELDETERKSALKQLSRASADRDTNRLRTESLRRFDADGNGRIDRDELDDFLDPPAEDAADKKDPEAASRQPARSVEQDRGN